MAANSDADRIDREFRELTGLAADAPLPPAEPAAQISRPAPPAGGGDPRAYSLAPEEPGDFREQLSPTKPLRRRTIYTICVWVAAIAWPLTWVYLGSSPTWVGVVTVILWILAAFTLLGALRPGGPGGHSFDADDGARI